MAAVVLAGLAGMLWAPADGPAAGRLVRLAAPRSTGHRIAPAGSMSWAVRLAAAGSVASAIAGAGPVSVILGVLALAVAWPVARRRRAEQNLRAAMARDLPRAIDLLASAVAAGASPPVAVATVADAISGPVGARLRPVAAALAGGWEPPAPATGDPAARLVRSLVRATATGAPLADAMQALSAEQRERSRWQAVERARSAGVRAVGPLGACFLPAFVLVGVVPVVAGIARALLTDWA